MSDIHVLLTSTTRHIDTWHTIPRHTYVISWSSNRKI